MTNLPAQLSTLQTEISVLTEKLSPVSEDRVTKSVRSLLAAGIALPAGMNADKAPDIYAFALAGIASQGVAKVTEKLIRGEYDIHLGFIPKPPEFASLARKESQKLVDDIARLRAKKNAIEEAEKLHEKSTPEQKARIRELHEMFKQAHAATKVERAQP